MIKSFTLRVVVLQDKGQNLNPRSHELW